MVNVYVHLHVCDLPRAILDDEGFIESVWRELPDAAISGGADVITITLSQFALARDRAAARQGERVSRALTALGYPDAVVRVGETLREGWGDDVRVVTAALRWAVCRRLSHM